MTVHSVRGNSVVTGAKFPVRYGCGCGCALGFSEVAVGRCSFFIRLPDTMRPWVVARQQVEEVKIKCANGQRRIVSWDARR